MSNHNIKKKYFLISSKINAFLLCLSKWDSPEFHRSKMDGQQPENNWVLLWETLSNCLWGPFVHPGHFYTLLQFLSRFSSRNFETQLRFHEIQNKQIVPSQMSTQNWFARAIHNCTALFSLGFVGVLANQTFYRWHGHLQKNLSNWQCNNPLDCIH